eukprot:GILK01008391.1.p1 GENE.GILK01008391.1~~GILK01008391.1.p1  ORF type:complete len:387 (+),score=76.66 GILK01008391.1:75-1235(+)
MESTVPFTPCNVPQQHLPIFDSNINSQAQSTGSLASVGQPVEIKREPTAKSTGPTMLVDLENNTEVPWVDPASESSHVESTQVADDVVMVNCKGDTMASFVHPRHTCIVYQFSSEPAKNNELHCNKCYCYICEVPANQCPQWSFSSQDAHCNGHANVRWRHLKAQLKRGKFKESSLAVKALSVDYVQWWSQFKPQLFTSPSFPFSKSSVLQECRDRLDQLRIAVESCRNNSRPHLRSTLTQLEREILETLRYQFEMTYESARDELVWLFNNSSHKLLFARLCPEPVYELSRSLFADLNRQLVNRSVVDAGDRTRAVQSLRELRQVYNAVGRSEAFVTQFRHMISQLSGKRLLVSGLCSDPMLVTAAPNQSKPLSSFNSRAEEIIIL